MIVFEGYPDLSRLANWTAVLFVASLASAALVFALASVRAHWSSGAGIAQNIDAAIAGDPEFWFILRFVGKAACASAVLASILVQAT